MISQQKAAKRQVKGRPKFNRQNKIMGIAKTINAIGAYDFYTSDYRLFIKTISTLFNVNLNVSFIAHIEEEKTEYDKESEFFDISQKDTFNLTVNYFKLIDNKPILDNVYCDYELRVPVDFEYEKELLLQFFTTGIFQLNYLPLNSTWNFFIEDLLGDNDHYYNSHSEVVKEKLSIRDEYIRILNKINCSEAIIWTDAQYKTESIIQEIQTIHTKLTLQDVIKSLEEIDKLTLYNFSDVLNQKLEIHSNRNSFLDIALFDNFNDKFETKNPYKQ